MNYDCKNGCSCISGIKCLNAMKADGSYERERQKVLGAPPVSFEGGDLYKQVAEEFHVTRAEVKLLCFNLVYRASVSNQDLLTEMRQTVHLAISLGDIKQKKD